MQTYSRLFLVYEMYDIVVFLKVDAGGDKFRLQVSNITVNHLVWAIKFGFKICKQLSAVTKRHGNRWYHCGGSANLFNFERCFPLPLVKKIETLLKCQGKWVAI